MGSHHHLRSSNYPPPYSQGYQPPTRASSANDFERHLAGVTDTIDSLAPLLAALKPSTDFEQGVVNYMRLVTAQLRELKIDHSKLRDEFTFRNRSYTEHLDNLYTSCVKSEQYTRRDTINVVGLAMSENESQDNLCSKIADSLSQSGEVVTVSDMSAVHRNARGNKTIRGKVVPPSVTVRFCNINMKDNVLKRYRNYDSAKNAVRDVRIYQSLSKHYSDLRSTILDLFKCDPADEKHGLLNCGMQLKWCTYQSPTSGFAIKLSNGDYFNKIHVWYDFVKQFQTKYPNSIIKG